MLWEKLKTLRPSDRAFMTEGRPELEGDPEEEISVVEGGKAILECKVKISTSATQNSPQKHKHHNITWTRVSMTLNFCV